MQISTQDILNALSHVEEPDLKKDLVTLNMVKDIDIKEKHVSFTIVLTTPACPLKDVIKNACINAIHHFVDKNVDVNVHFTANVGQGKANTDSIKGIKNIIAVGSGKGGVGKSTVAVNLAIALAAAGSRVGFLDADIYGPSAPVMFGLLKEKPAVQTINEKDYMLPILRFGVKVMSIGLLVDPSQPIMWRGPMASKGLQQLLHDSLWGEIDYLIIDLPPGTGDVHITICQQFPLTGAIIVTTPQEVALADARKATAMFLSEALKVPVIGVIENMSYFIPDDMPEKKYYIFGKNGGEMLAKEFNIPFLGALPLQEPIRTGGDEGAPAALQSRTPHGKAFEQLAMRVAQEISIRNNL